ncbi:MAG: GxxExxY protein [Parcubacteria group bacterium]
MPTPADLTKTITSLAHDVYRHLGSGFDEKVYENAKPRGLRLAKIPYQAQKVVELTYKDHYVGEGYPDLIVGAVQHRLILELKAMLNGAHRILGLNHGLLINFQAPGQNTKGRTKLEIRHVRP